MHERLVAVIASTSAGGKPNDATLPLWAWLHSKLPPDALASLNFGVCGLGHSDYEQHYNVVGKVRLQGQAKCNGPCAAQTDERWRAGIGQVSCTAGSAAAVPARGRRRGRLKGGFR